MLILLNCMQWNLKNETESDGDLQIISFFYFGLNVAEYLVTAFSCLLTH